MSLLQQLLDRGERDEARAAALKVLAARPTDGEALSTLARLELENRNVEAAEQYLARVAPRERQSYEVQLSEAMVQQLSGQPDAARLAFAQLTAAFPTRSEAFFALGLAFLEKQDAQGAERALATAVQLHPTHFLYRYRHGEALAQSAKFVEAAAELTKCIELRPDFTPAYLAFARMLETDGQGERALEIVGAALGAMPTDRRLLAEQARLRMAAGDVAGALAQADAMTGGAVGLAEELVRANAFSAAVEVCEQLERSGKGSAKVSLVKGLAHESAGRTTEALEAYAQAMASDPSDWAAANNRGLLLLEQFQDDAARLEEAKANLEEAVRRSGGKVADPLLNLALLHGRRSDWAQGIAFATQVIAHPAAGPLKAQAEKMVVSMKKAAHPA